MTTTVAIIGSGPSGFFSADSLLKARPDVQVHMFDRLPTPYGLIRSGVAPDHQHIKRVTSVFEKIASHPSFQFTGNVEIGKTVELDVLRRLYDAVVIATGAPEGVRIGVPGDDLNQSHTAAEFVSWYNGHPDFVELSVDPRGKAAVLFGHGNVAIDVARILLSDIDYLDKTDIADHALDTLRDNPVRSVYLAGRRGPLQASFTTAELRALLAIPGLRVVIDPADLDFGPAAEELLSLPANALLSRNIELLRAAAARSEEPHTKELHLLFRSSPVEIRGQGKVDAVEFRRNRLTDGLLDCKVTTTDERFTIEAGLAVACIGFRSRRLPGVPFDERKGGVSHVRGKVVDEHFDGKAPLYVAGWIKRGPSGVIGSNRADAAETIETLLADLDQVERASRPQDVGETRIGLPRYAIDFEMWRRIDQAERSAGALREKPRCKFVSVEAMLNAAAHAH